MTKYPFDPLPNCSIYFKISKTMYSKIPLFLGYRLPNFSSHDIRNIFFFLPSPERRLNQCAILKTQTSLHPHQFQQLRNSNASKLILKSLFSSQLCQKVSVLTSPHPQLATTPKPAAPLHLVPILSSLLSNIEFSSPHTVYCCCSVLLYSQWNSGKLLPVEPPNVQVMVYNLTTSFTSIIYFMYYNITCVASVAARIPLPKKIHNTSYLSTSIHSHAHNTPIIISCQHAPNIHKRLPIQDGCHNQALMNPDGSHQQLPVGSSFTFIKCLNKYYQTPLMFNCLHTPLPFSINIIKHL